MQVVHPRILLTTRYESRFFREIFHGIVAYAHQHTHWQMVCQIDATAAQLRDIAPAGIFTTGAEPGAHKWARAANIPLVMLSPAVQDPRASLVSVDEEAVGAMAVDHFASLGVKHLAYVGHGDWPFVHYRLAGFLNAAAGRGYGPVSQLVGLLYNPRRRPRFERDLRAMLGTLPRPCGLFAAGDTVGVIIVQTCREMGLRVPDDIAVLGVDNDELACELSEVPLSSIVQPLGAIGYEAAHLMHQQIQSNTNQPARVALPPVRVVGRASTDLIAIEDEDVAAALRLIKNHFAEPINVAWVVDHLPVARRSLYRRFMKLVGRTVLQQIRHVRFQRAKELLAESDLSLDMVAKRSGFANALWMADSFRRELRTTPSRFRRGFRPNL